MERVLLMRKNHYSLAVIMQEIKTDPLLNLKHISQINGLSCYSRVHCLCHSRHITQSHPRTMQPGFEKCTRCCPFQKATVKGKIVKTTTPLSI